MESFKQFNWVDIFVLILVFRVCYIALKTGFSAELFKFLGILVALYLAMHYYPAISGGILKHIPAQNLFARFVNVLVFISLAILGYLVFAVLRNLSNLLFKTEAVSLLNKWGGLFLGMARAVLLTGLIIFIFAMSGINYLTQSVKSSYTAKRIISVAPNTYIWIWENITSKFFTAEKCNQEIISFKEGFLQ